MTRRAPGQVLPLTALRWRMVRSRRARNGLLVALSVFPLLALAAIAAGALAPTGQETELAVLTPSILLAFFGLAVIAPLAAGGGNELYPPDQLVAYPIRTRTIFRAALLLAPLNLAWLLQVLAALGLTTYVVHGSVGAVLAALVTMLVYLVVVTVAGQGIAWIVVGLRQTRAGRLACWVVVAVITAVVLALVAAGALTEALDRAPTRWVFSTALDAGGGHWAQWALGTALLAAGGAYSLVLSERACRWSFGRPADAGAPGDARPHTRRSLGTGERHVLVVLARRGIWRARAVRRGALLLGLLPGALLAASAVGWDSLLLLPGLVAAGAGMLFGINAFCLDDGGATWIATLPHRPAVTFWARTQVVVEVTAAIVVVAVIGGALRAPTPNTTQLVCFVAAVLVAVARVSATCMHLSVTRPHRAQLLGPRDAPAPPGAMALYSVRLASSAAVVGISFALVAEVGSVLIALLLAFGYLALAARTLLRASRTWADPVARARVVAVVSAG